MTIEELSAIVGAKRYAHHLAQNACHAEKREAVKRVADEIEARHRPALDAASAELAAAEKALRMAKDEAARRGEGARLPIGSKYEEWSIATVFSRTERRTGRVGVIVMWTSDMICKHHGEAPKIGDTALVVLRKDGSPSRIAYRIGVHPLDDSKPRLPWGWRPVETDDTGETP